MGNYLVIAAIAALLLFRLYRRGRSLVGEQPYSEKKMRRRLLSLAVVLALLLWDDWNLAHAALANASPALATALLYMLLGIGGGAVLGVWAARLAELRWDAGTLKLRGHRKLPRQADSLKVELSANCCRYSLGVRSPRES